MATADAKSPSHVEQGPIEDGPDHQSTFIGTLKRKLFMIFNYLRNGLITITLACFDPAYMVASREQRHCDKIIETFSNTIYKFYEEEVIKKEHQQFGKPDEIESLQILLGKYGSFICPFF